MFRGESENLPQNMADRVFINIHICERHSNTTLEVSRHYTGRKLDFEKENANTKKGIN